MVQSSSNENLKRQIRSGAVLLLLLFVLVFALQNTESVSVVFLLWELVLPRALVLLVFFLAGFLSGLAFSNWKKLISTA